MTQIPDFVDFVGKGQFTFFVGVVEDNSDPMTLGRVKVRCFGIHPEDRTEVPTKDLPWAQVLQPTTSSAISGLGWSPNGLELGSWVMGFFLDGKYAQYPLVLGTFPGIHRPNAPGSDIGNSGAGYLNTEDMYSGEAGPAPYYGQGTENPDKYTGQNLPNSAPGGQSGTGASVGTANTAGDTTGSATSTPLTGNIGVGASGAVIRDDGRYLTKANISNWPLQIYTPKPAGGRGLACKDGRASLRIHYASALALEALTRDYGVASFTINSGYRTPAYNARLSGSAKNSMHIEGRAFDISYRSIGASGPNDRATLTRFGKLAVKNGFRGFGLYGSFVHIDTGSGRVWRGATAPWFVAALKEAGWRHGLKGLDGVKVTPGSSVNPDTQVPEAGNTETNDTMLNLISQNEGTAGPNGYNTSLGYGAYTGGEHVLTDMNLNQIDSLQTEMLNNPNNKFNSSALGKYQITRTTLRGLRQEMGLSGDEKFSPELQDEMARRLVARRNGSLAGLRNEWTSLRKVPDNVIMAALQGQGTGAYSSLSKGFQDPTNSLPFGAYRGKPSTHHAARGLNGNMFQPEASERASNRTSGVPIAGDRGTFGEPDSAFNAQYPYNKTYATKSGHLMEFDDTPGSERVNIAHKSGTLWEVSAKGTATARTIGNRYQIDHQNLYHAVLGDMFLTSQGDLMIRSTSDSVIHTDGSNVVLVGNDQSTYISGKMDLGVGEVLQVKAKRIIFEAPKIDMYATSEFNLHSEGAMNLKGKSINIEAADGMSMKSKSMKIEGSDSMDLKTKDAKITGSSGVNIKSDDLKLGGGSNVQMQASTVNFNGAEPDEADDAKSAKDASSTDIGKIPARKKIQKQLNMRENPDALDGFEQGMEHYTGNTQA